MKNILLTAFFFLLFFRTQAQQIAVNTEPVTKIPVSALNWENQKLRSDLSLNDSQFIAIKDITVERFKARQIVEEMFKHEPKKKVARTREIERQFDTEFEEVLTSKQYKKYLKLQGRDQEAVETKTAAVQEPEGPNFNAQIQALIKKATTPVLDSALIPKQQNGDQDFAIQPDSLMEILPAGFHAGQATSPDAVQKNVTLITGTEPEFPQKQIEQDPIAGTSLKSETGGGELKPENTGNDLPIIGTEEIKVVEISEPAQTVTPPENINYTEGLEMMAP